MFSSFKPLFPQKSSKAPTPPKWRPEKNQSSSNDGNIADKWELIMGKSHWDTLLDPLDMDLRRILIHYGEICQATYDTFIHDKFSKFAGASKYNKNNFFAKLGLELGHPYRYRVTKFIYATSGVDMPKPFILKSLSTESWSKDSNFMGYIAVAEDESVRLLGRREIVVAWRGTLDLLEWVSDEIQSLASQLTSSPSHSPAVTPSSHALACTGSYLDEVVRANDILGQEPQAESKGEMHQGWHSMYTSENLTCPYDKRSARDQVLTELKKLVEQYKDEAINITVTGHSLGASLATINAVDIAANNINLPVNCPTAKPCMVTAIIFASPRVGDEHFKDTVSKIDNLRILRVRNVPDVIPDQPLFGFSEIGKELIIDTTQSMYLKNPATPVFAHILEAYLHGIAGIKGGEEGKFELVIQRDIALLNKSIDMLKDDYLVPMNWWVQSFNGMVQQEDGYWVLMDHEMDAQE